MNYKASPVQLHCRKGRSCPFAGRHVTWRSSPHAASISIAAPSALLHKSNGWTGSDKISSTSALDETERLNNTVVAHTEECEPVSADVRKSIRRRIAAALRKEDTSDILGTLDRLWKCIQCTESLAEFETTAPEAEWSEAPTGTAWAFAYKPEASCSHEPGCAKSSLSKRLSDPRKRGLFLFSLDGYHSRIVRLFLRKHEPQAALNYMAQMPLNRAVHGSLLHEVVKHGTLDLMVETVKLRHFLGLSMDAHALSSVIAAASKVGAFPLASEALAAATEACIPLDALLYNTLLDSAARAADSSRFEAVWAEVVAAGLSHDAAAYASRAKLLVNTGRCKAVAELVRVLVAERRDLLSPHLFSTAFSAAASDPSAVPFATLLATWDDMQGCGIEVNDHLLSAFYGAAKCTPLEANNVETCFTILADFRAARKKPQVGVLSNIVYVCANSGYGVRVLDIWDIAEEDQMRLNPAVIGAMLHACKAAAGEPGICILARKLEAELKARWLEREPHGAAGERRSAWSFRVAFNALLLYHAAAGGWTAGRGAFEFMRESGPEPDMRSFNAMLHICGRTGQASAAAALLAAMPAAGFTPDELSYGCVLDACAKACEVGRAHLVLASMRASGLAPNVVAYTSVMHACVREGSEESLTMAMDLMDTIRESGLQPTSATYYCALGVCEATGDADTALRLYHEACDGAVPLTDTTHNRLINVFTHLGCLDEALEQVKALLRQKGAMQQQTLNSLTRALADAYIDRALCMLRFMRLRSMQPTHKTWHALVAAAARAAMPDSALQLYTEMRGQGHLPSSNSGSALVCALCRASQLEHAVFVLQDMHNCSNGLTAPQAELAAAVSRGAEGSRPSTPQVSCSAQELGARLEAAVSKVLPLQLSRGGAEEAAREEVGGTLQLLRKGRRGRRQARHRQLQKGDMLPHAEAVAELVLALCLQRHREPAVVLYRELAKTGQTTMIGLSRHLRQMFEQLIELSCRKGDIMAALGVFDDWKAARDAALRACSSPAPPQDVPRLSNVTLAFLEACCHAQHDPELHWRVYDVCALMRQQQELRRASRLPQPGKGSHHVADMTLDVDLGDL